MEGLASEHE